CRPICLHIRMHHPILTPFPTRRSSDLYEEYEEEAGSDMDAASYEEEGEADDMDTEAADAGEANAEEDSEDASEADVEEDSEDAGDRKSTRLNSSHVSISYAVFCWKKKTQRVEPVEKPDPHPGPASLDGLEAQ